MAIILKANKVNLFVSFFSDAIHRTFKTDHVVANGDRRSVFLQTVDHLQISTARYGDSQLTVT
jgi:hypothetical protein